MATFEPIAIATNITTTTKFSDYKNKIQASMDEFGTSMNDALVEMFNTLSTETTYTEAEINTIITDLTTVVTDATAASTAANNTQDLENFLNFKF